MARFTGGISNVRPIAHKVTGAMIRNTRDCLPGFPFELFHGVFMAN